eukprot:823641-Prymnesium_polylepis.1
MPHCGAHVSLRPPTMMGEGTSPPAWMPSTESAMANERIGGGTSLRHGGVPDRATSGSRQGERPAQHVREHRRGRLRRGGDRLSAWREHTPRNLWFRDPASLQHGRARHLWFEAQRRYSMIARVIPADEPKVKKTPPKRRRRKRGLERAEPT